MPAEHDVFLKAADDAEVREVRTFCATLAYTGCWISEALALIADRIDLKDGAIVSEVRRSDRREYTVQSQFRRHFSTC